MAGIERIASAEWQGELKTGKGTIGTTSGVLQDTPYTFATRFEDAKGTNPEEMIAAAHASCYSMAFAHHLSGAGHKPESIRTKATITLDAGKITKMHLETRGRVPGLSGQDFKRLAVEAEQKCPVSNLLRPGLTISLDAALA